MWTCPVCGSTSFNDVSFCLACLHVRPEKKKDEPTVKQFETKTAAQTPVSPINLPKPWWMVEGFEQLLGRDAKKFNLPDCGDDVFVYRRLNGEFEEFIYWVEKVFAYTAFVRKHGVPLRQEYGDTTSDAFDALQDIELGARPAREVLSC